MLLAELHARFAGHGLERLVALRLQHIARELHVLLVVFDDEDRAHGLVPNRESDGESGPFAGRTREADLAAVQLDEALGAREAEASAFGLARVITSDLLEFLEHHRLVF